MYSTYVDMYNSTSNSWSSHPTGLGQARGALAAASLPSGLVFFAGGQNSGAANIVCHLLLRYWESIFFCVLFARLPALVSRLWIVFLRISHNSAFVVWNADRALMLKFQLTPAQRMWICTIRRETAG